MLERHLACLGPSGFHCVAYDEWPGPPGAPTLVCVHGLSRNARDFDVFAAAMSKTPPGHLPGHARSRAQRMAEESGGICVSDLFRRIARR